MAEFAAVVDQYWSGQNATAREVYRGDALTVLVDSSVDESRRISIVRRVDGPTTVILSPAVEQQLGLDVAAQLTEQGFLANLARHNIDLYDADNLFYFDAAVRDDLTAEADPANVRKLDAADADVFAKFESSASEQDREDSFVELDHWAVFGAFDGDQLVAAASAYPWGGVTLADIGVLTLEAHRGRGLARQVVCALSRYALSVGHEPQYRCQLENTASVALAGSVGLTRYGTWQVVSPDSPN